MLRPKRMSRVSVTGTKRVMPDVIEIIHELNLVHLVGYDGSWEGFGQGDPMPHGDEVSERLVTVRSIENILGVEETDDTVDGSVPEDAIDAELEEIRTRVNDLDDRRSDLRDQRRALEDQIAAAEPFVDLGIDLELLTGYDSLTVRVGEGNEPDIREAVAALDEPLELFSGDRTVAVFAAAPGESVDDALVGVEFARIEIPDAQGTPEEYIAGLEAEKAEIDDRLADVETELESLKLDAGQFLLAAEERLTIEAQKTEAPLSFATTENAFIAEGWVPSDRFDDIVTALDESVGELVTIEELERADYDRHGHVEHSEMATDGGTDLAMAEGTPPVVQDTPSFARPFELLVQTVSRPRYSELDPTILVFLTFPTFFGFMIGDLGYGIVYTLVGYLMVTRLDNEALRSLGGVAIWCGVFTMLFGVLYGEFFGLHVLGDIVWHGHPPMEKGLDAIDFALLWLFMVMILGLVHVGAGYVLGFINTLQHGVVDAVLESGSWFMLMFGVWVWILSKHLGAAKPDFIFTIVGHGPDAVFALGFTGFSQTVGLAALATAAIGLVLMVYGEYRHLGEPALIAGPLEALQVLVNVLSYARITAVLLAKAGMAFVVNLLFFGVYEHGGAHFMHSTTPQHVVAEYGSEAVVFPGLVHGGVVSIVGGLFVLVLGHATVWGLGITSAGLQAIRLEYVEFFQKFYEGGGEVYNPFGYERTFTAEE